jgi:lysophospholipase L1-like esterase
MKYTWFRPPVKASLWLRAFLFLLLAAFCIQATVSPPKAKAATIIGFGVMSDSSTDEYRQNDQRGGDTYGPTTLNWLEQLAIYRDINFGTLKSFADGESWGSPRRSGYEYNWSRSGATSASLLSSGQHTGLAKQVQEGKVNLVLLRIGANDYEMNNVYDDIYWGRMSAAEREALRIEIVSNIAVAATTILEANADNGLPPPMLVIAGIPDLSDVFVTWRHYPDEARRQVVSDDIHAVNAQIMSLAERLGVPYLDIQGFVDATQARIDSNGFLSVGGVQINAYGIGDEPTNLVLSDIHAGTVAEGLFANYLIDFLNQHFDVGIAPFTEDEIIQIAGLG